MADEARSCVDPAASPLRLTMEMLAKRLASGRSLPPPAVAYDCTTGCLLPGTMANPDN